MTDDSGNDRRRDIKGRIDTLGTGTNGVSGRRTANRVGDRITRRRADDEAEGADAALVDEESDDDEATDEEAADREDESDDDADPEADTAVAEDEHETDQFGAHDDELGEGDEFGEDEADDADVEPRTEDVDERSTLEVEIDPFVRAYAARRAAEKGDESLDEYVVGSVKGYLAGLLGGEVSSPGTLQREVDVEVDEIFGGMLEAVADDDESVEDVVVAAVAEAYDVPVDEETLVVAGLRDHEALLNGVVANSSNDLGDVSEVVQAAVETRLLEEPA